MKFVHPEMLWGMLALAIPVLVHLFNFRKFKRVMFPNIDFLKEIKQETHNKSKLKHLLILAARCLAIMAIVLAFAQPFIPMEGSSLKPGNQAISIYIDNSFSMEGAAREGRLLDLAKNKALEIVSSFSPSDKFQLLTSDFEGRHQRLVSRDEMTQLIQEVEVSPISRQLSDVVLRQTDVLNKSGLQNKRAFVLTDLQESVSGVDPIKMDSTIRFYVVPEEAQDISNIYIDSVWFDSPIRALNQPEVLQLRVVNSGDEDRENVPIQLLINGQQKSVSSIQVPANGSQETSIVYINTDTGFKKATLHVDDGGIAKDDDFYFDYAVANQLAVLEIQSAESGNAVEAVFADDPHFLFTRTTENNIDFSSLIRQNFIILNQLQTISSGLMVELVKFAQGGGSVLIIPASHADLLSYNALLSKIELGQMGAKRSDASKVTMVNYEHFLLKDVLEKSMETMALPTVQMWYEINSSSRSSVQTVLGLQNGMPFLVSNSVGSGRAYLACVSLSTDESNFIRHAFFPASLIRMAEYSQPSQPLYYFLGKEQVLLLRNTNLNNEESLRMRNSNTGEEFIPEHRNSGANTEVYIHTDLRNAGHYDLLQGELQVAGVAMNYDRLESNTRAFSIDAFRSQLENAQLSNWSILTQSMESIAAGTSELNEGKKYWWTLIVMALIFLAIEVLLIKFWR